MAALVPVHPPTPVLMQPLGGRDRSTMRSLSDHHSPVRLGVRFDAGGSITADTVRTGSLLSKSAINLPRIPPRDMVGEGAVHRASAPSPSPTTPADRAGHQRRDRPAQRGAGDGDVDRVVGSIQPISERISATARIVISTLRIGSKPDTPRPALRGRGREEPAARAQKSRLLCRCAARKVNRSSGLPWAAPCTQISQRRREPPWLSTRADASSSAAGSNPRRTPAVGR